MATVRHLGLFPWCPYKNKQDVADRLYFGDAAPIDQQIGIYEGLSMPLRDAVAMYWRVKTWRLHGSIQANGGAGVSTIPFDVTFGPQIASEKNYVCRYFDGGNWLNIPHNQPTFSGVVAGFEGEQTFEFSIVLFYGPFLLPQVYRFGFAHFAQWVESSSPSLDASVYVWTTMTLSASAGGDFLFTQIFDNDSGTSDPIDVPVTFLGKTYNMQKNVEASGLEYSYSIEAQEYWPYDPGDGGGPIYDSATGAQLRAFPN